MMQRKGDVFKENDMIAGNLIVFRGEQEGPEIDNPVLIELTEWGTEIEIAADAGRRRVYLRFRLEDLVREVKEARSA
jgi:hypothetical protein